MTSNTKKGSVMKIMEDIYYGENQTILYNDIEKYIISENELLIDIKTMMKDCFIGTFKEKAQSIEVTFINGQKFEIIIKSIKHKKNHNLHPIK